MEQTSVILQKSRKKRIEEGHPWVYSSEIDRLEGEAEPGDLVRVLTHLGKYVATGYWNPQSQITVRVVSYTELTEMDKAFFIQRLQECKAYRERFVPDHDCRLVYGEADFLPGLIVDRFKDVLVVQLLTLGMEKAKQALLEALIEVFEPGGIYERSDVSVRKLEGLEERAGLLHGECPSIVEIEENGLKLEVDIVNGQKTGYFFDQRENRAAIAPLMTGWGGRSGIKLGLLQDEPEAGLVPVNSNGKRVSFPYWDGATVLECFAHTGSFTLNACKHGAKKVTCLDVSQHAIDTARSNVERNGFSDRVEFIVADAFDYLRSQVNGLQERKQRSEGGALTAKKLEREGRTWDVVILDPPAFAKTKNAVAGARRGYKDINLQGLKLVNEGGYLVTASCSYHMLPDLFLEAVHEAAKDAGKLLRLVEWRAAGKDHPQRLGVSEGHYLKFAIFEVRSKSKE
ncbi:class I SAM-dependent rRNA methyltransferase [Paenibacillus sp. HB172176]|uniref:class I SAM-dependent rRNA methyltransferase n=1 Tax=Paenibacillus sp. HB172176 TaxID=2493690 RepID=UPI00143A8154|nr:class I SAM-dependent rRNA methyltransferase [Paenibacillus sp. HB172176]